MSILLYSAFMYYAYIMVIRINSRGDDSKISIQQGLSSVTDGSDIPYSDLSHNITIEGDMGTGLYVQFLLAG